MKKHREMIFDILLIVIILLVLIPTLLGGIGPLPPREIRPLAKAYLNSTLNIYNKDLWTASPEAVAAIVWDYRGLDTFYETIVFYTAIVSCLILYREIL
ncbi:MAG: sodium:proton antiporter, partial [Ignisphaera sp.]